MKGCQLVAHDLNLFFFVLLFLFSISYQLLWAAGLEEWMKKMGWLVTVLVMPVLAVGGFMGQSLFASFWPAIGYAVALVAPLLIGVWLWVPFVGENRAGRIVRRFMNEREGARNRDGLFFIESTELKGQWWHVYGWWVDHNFLRHHFLVKVHSKCGNVMVC